MHRVRKSLLFTAEDAPGVLKPLKPLHHHVASNGCSRSPFVPRPDDKRNLFLCFFRAMVGGNSGPATEVKASPLVECLCKKLQSVFNSPQKKDGKSVSRWRLILGAYHHIRQLVTLNSAIMDNTNIQLYELNQTTLIKWYDLVLATIN